MITYWLNMMGPISDKWYIQKSNNPRLLVLFRENDFAEDGSRNVFNIWLPHKN